MVRGVIFAIGLLAASPCVAQVVSPLSLGGNSQTAIDAANNAAAAAAAAQITANNAQASADSAVKSVNGLTPTAGAVTVPLPTASAVAPPCVADTGATGTTPTMTYAPWNHTHCSKTRRITATTATDGSYTFGDYIPCKHAVIEA